MKFWDEEEEEKELEKAEKSETDQTDEKKGKFRFLKLIIPLAIFLLALGVRLAFLFANDPQSPGYGWYGDVYHHWQVAYLTKEVGFQHGFLRLWDLKGMEFFWGLAHPLSLIGLFSISHSVDIIIPRLLSIVAGSFVAVEIYLIIKRSFGYTAAIASGLWVALFSVTLFSDTLGMQEQLGLFFLLGGILVWPKQGWLTGLLWAASAMTRSEYWLFSIGLLLAALFDRQRNTTSSKISMFTAYILPIIFYMKYLHTWTGNAIYPIYWNFLASVVGKWFTNVSEPLGAVQIQGQWIGRGLLALGFLGAIVAFFKRPKSYLLFLLGFFNVAFIGFMFGFAAYIHGFFDRFWVDRLLSFPYLFLGILIIVLSIYWLPNLLPKAKMPLKIIGFLFFLVMLAASQLAWGKIFYYFRMAQKPYELEVKNAELIAKNDSGEGKILFPAGRPALTYALVRNHGISGKRIVSEMYDPFYYAKAGETPEQIQEKVIWWLEGEEIRLIAYTGKSEYKGLFEAYPDKFKLLAVDEGVSVYEFLR